LRSVANSTRRRLQWFYDPITPFRDYLEDTRQLADLYTTGVVRLRGAHELAKALAALDEQREPESRKEMDLDYEEQLTTLAHSEVDSGFRLLNSHLLVGLWGVFESTVDALVIRWMSERPEDVAWPDDEEVKLPPRAVFSADPQERAEVFFEAVRKRRGTPLKRGIARFEETLAIVGLNGPLPEGLSDTVFEMQQVRNVYAHSGGRVDARFLESCPYLPLAAGDIVPVTSTVASTYYAAFANYAVLLIKRSWAKNGMVHTADNDLFWNRSISPSGVLENMPDLSAAREPLRAHFCDVGEQAEAESLPPNKGIERTASALD